MTVRVMPNDEDLVRFLVTPEDPEAAAPGKPPMERECLRTGYGTCQSCGDGERFLFRYEIDPAHAEWLDCLCEEWHDGLCASCRDGGPGNGGCVSCFDEDCFVAEWLQEARLPWLCVGCWATETAAEQAHVAELEARA